MYLWLVDVFRCNQKKNILEDFENREPGYSQSLAKAYLYALKLPKYTGVMDINLLKGIHERAMTFKSNSKDNVPGRIRRSPNNLSGSTKVDTMAGVNGSIRGYFQFLKDWYITQNNPVYFALSFRNISNLLHIYQSTIIMVLNYNKDSKKFKVATREQMSTLSIMEVTMDELTNKIVMLQDGVNQGVIMDYTTSQIIDPNALAYEPLNMEAKEIEKTVTCSVENIMKDFNKVIFALETVEDKVRCIVKHIQLIEQVHPFVDGNMRSLAILMNKLLRDHGCGMSLMMNQNVFDFHSVDEIVPMVMDGIERFKLIKAQKDNKGDLVLMNGDAINKINLSKYVAAKIIKEMVDVMNDGPKELSKDLGMFGKVGQKANYHKLVSKQLDKDEFTKAFHSACMVDTRENILSIISEYDQHIDFDAAPVGRSSWTDLIIVNKNRINTDEIKAHISNMEKCLVPSSGKHS